MQSPDVGVVANVYDDLNVLGSYDLNKATQEFRRAGSTGRLTGRPNNMNTVGQLLCG